MSKQPDEKPEVLRITDVPESHTDEMHRRVVKYSLAMGIRLACLLLFFFIDSWFRWFFVAGAVFLPWIAVIIANGGSDKSHLTHSAALLDQAPQPELEAPAAHATGGDPEAEDFLTGVVIDDAGQPFATARPTAGAEERPTPPAEPADLPEGPSDGAGSTTGRTGSGPAASDRAAPDRAETDAAAQDGYDQPAAFMGNLSPVVKRRRRRTAA